MGESPIILDVLGARCPIPVKKVRQALRELPEGTRIHVLGDDPESLHDIPALLIRLELKPAIVSLEEKGWKFTIYNCKIL